MLAKGNKPKKKIKLRRKKYSRQFCENKDYFIDIIQGLQKGGRLKDPEAKRDTKMGEDGYWCGRGSGHLTSSITFHSARVACCISTWNPVLLWKSEIHCCLFALTKLSKIRLFLKSTTVVRIFALASFSSASVF